MRGAVYNNFFSYYYYFFRHYILIKDGILSHMKRQIQSNLSLPTSLLFIVDTLLPIIIDFKLGFFLFRKSFSDAPKIDVSIL